MESAHSARNFLAFLMSSKGVFGTPHYMKFFSVFMAFFFRPQVGENFSVFKASWA